MALGQKVSGEKSRHWLAWSRRGCGRRRRVGQNEDSGHQNERVGRETLKRSGKKMKAVLVGGTDETKEKKLMDFCYQDVFQGRID